MTTRLKQLVESLGGQLIGDENVAVSGIAPLDQAQSSHITFLTNAKFRSQAAATAAAALILSAADDAIIGSEFNGVRIVVDNPYVYFARVAQYFVDRNQLPRVLGIHSSAVVDVSAKIGQDVLIGPHVVIEADVVIGDRCVIDAGCFVGRGVKLGDDTHLFARVTLHAMCEIGARGIVHSGAVIGTDGFGFANDNGAWLKIPQTGRVMIGNDVEVGANTTIDRGALSDTVIEDGVKLDNQIQIAHNCHVGAHTAMAACVGIAGSVTIGKYCSIGGAAMISGHLTIADHVHISAGSFVLKSISARGQYTGFYPIATHTEWEKSAVLVRSLPTLRVKIRELEKTIKSLHQQKKQNDND